MNYRKIRRVSIIILFIVLGFGIYSNTLNSPFFFDDIIRIRENPDIRLKEFSLDGLAKAALGKDSAKSRPIGNITFALNYYFHGYDLKGYHLINIIIHLLNAILLYIFFNLTLANESRRRSLNTSDNKNLESIQPVAYQSKNKIYICVFAAMIWLVHPLHTQSVTYIVQRLNSMAALFFLLSFILFIKGRLSFEGLPASEGIVGENSMPDTSDNQERRKRKGRKKKKNRSKRNDLNVTALSYPSNRSYFIWYSLAAISWFIALGTKQIAATLPFFIFLYEYYFFRDLDRRWLLNNLKWLIGLIILSCLIAFIFLGPDPLERLMSGRDFDNDEFSYSERVLTQFRVVIYYLSLIFFPHPSRLRLDYDFNLSNSLISPVSTILCLGLIAAILCSAIVIARKERLLSFCILWFFGNLVIESSVVPLAIIYEHRTYLPSMLVVLFTTTLIYGFIRPKWIKITLLIAVISVFSLWTYERNKVWKDDVSLWSDVADKSPSNYTAHTNLGIALDRRGRTDEAIPHYLAAIKLKPDYAEAHNNLGIALEKKGSLEEAFYHYSEALKLDPRDENAQNNLGLFLLRQKRYEKAVGYFHEALRLRYHFPAAHYNLGIALLNLKRLEEALVHFQKAEELIQDNPGVYYYLGLTLGMIGRYSESADYLRRSLQLAPGNSEVQKRLESVLDMKKKQDE
ncbi:MAG: tetratricopeptide repeat protein [Deltaproteobacteria bacterium]|nr:tetratricopeptide repeat protein [Deltaproteobacteria bacterium]